MSDGTPLRALSTLSTSESCFPFAVKRETAMTSRREFISTATLAAAGVALAPLAACSQERAAPAAANTAPAKPFSGTLITRAIPSSGEKIPVIGMGGIASAADALEFIIAGASAVQIGTANFVDPFIWSKVLHGLQDYMRRHSVTSIAGLVGSIDTSAREKEWISS